MAIPKDILAVQRPSSTVVNQRGTRFVVVKRTSERVGNRVVPVDRRTICGTKAGGSKGEDHRHKGLRGGGLMQHAWQRPSGRTGKGLGFE